MSHSYGRVAPDHEGLQVDENSNLPEVVTNPPFQDKFGDKYAMQSPQEYKYKPYYSAPGPYPVSDPVPMPSGNTKPGRSKRFWILVIIAALVVVVAIVVGCIVGLVVKPGAKRYVGVIPSRASDIRGDKSVLANV
jgi:hypothetical protein